MMRVMLTLCLFVASVFLPGVVWAQATSGGEAKPPSAVALEMIARVQSAIVGVAEIMPAEKYDFAPTSGEFRGVRNFARQIKHAAAVQYLVGATILGERVTADMAEERGPDNTRTKAEVIQYLKESFDALKRAAATLDAANALTVYKGPFGETANTRLGSIALAVEHTWNHYGQVVPYLRMNGLTPQVAP